MPTKKRENPNQGRVYDTDGVSPSLNKMEGGGRQPMVIDHGKVRLTDDRSMCIMATYYKGLDNHGARTAILQKGRGFNEGGLHEIAPTLTKNSWEHNNHLINGYRIRRLTPKECWRLQGIPDLFTDKVIAGGSVIPKCIEGQETLAQKQSFMRLLKNSHKEGQPNETTNQRTIPSYTRTI